MLNINDLININSIPKESEISLNLLIDFYEQYLCRRIFIFTLKNNVQLKLFFKETSEIFHISGIDHIYEGIPMDGTRFINGIKNNKINLKTIENINSAAYTDYIDRIRSMFCIDTIIKNCEYLFYSKGKIPNSDIKVTYLLLKGLDGKNLHLGIDTYKEGRPYFARTLLVTEGETAQKFIDKSDERLKVVKLEIKDKDTGEILECIDREDAELYVERELQCISDKWLKTEFEQILNGFFKISDMDNQVLNEWENEIIQNINNINKDITDLIKMRTDFNVDEWKELLSDTLQTCFKNGNEFRRIIEDNQEKYHIYFYNRINRHQKDVWKKRLHEEIEYQKATIKHQASKMDPYWSGKIVGEGIRRFKKEETSNRIEMAMESFISNQSLEIVSCIIENSLKNNIAAICSYIANQI